MADATVAPARAEDTLLSASPYALWPLLVLMAVCGAVFVLIGVLFNGWFVLFMIPVLITLAMMLLKRVQLNRLAEVHDALAGEEVIDVAQAANFFGQRSRGLKQVRGNGVLALTTSKLYFLMWAPRRELVIPHRQICDVDIVDSFLQKTKFQPLLKVVFRPLGAVEGADDAAAWLVSDPERWREQIVSSVPALQRSE